MCVWGHMPRGRTCLGGRILVFRGACVHTRPVILSAALPPPPSCQVGKSSTLLPHLPPPPSSQVGKSSTLNSLLGSHRVAVSSHPG